MIRGLALVLLIALAGCMSGEGEDPECKALAPQGRCASVEGCCTTTECWYDVNGNRFDCTGTDCVEARGQVDQLCGLTDLP
jgi:hypothetical protein